MSTLESLLSERILVLDGAMGTELQRLGLGEADFRGERFKNHARDLRGDYDALSLTRPALVSRVHCDYLEAGCDIIRTNTFGSTAIVQAHYGLTTCGYELNVVSAQLARKACDAWIARTPRQPRFVAGTIGPTDRSVSSHGGVGAAASRVITFDQLKNAYKEQARGLVDGGCDILLVETVFDVLNAGAALAAIEETCLNRPLPVMLSATVSDPDGRTLAGQTIGDFWTAVAPAGPLSVGLNCSAGARAMRPHLAALAGLADCWISCHPSAGLPDTLGRYRDQPGDLARVLGDFAASQLVNIVGGCCGTTPEHVKAIVEAVRGVPPRSRRRASDD